MSDQRQYKYVLPAGFVLKGGASDYVVEEVLGKGGFGITYKVKSRLLYQNIYVDVHFAVKEFFPDNCWRGNDNATLLAPPTKQDEIHDGLQDFINEGHRLQQVCKLKKGSQQRRGALDRAANDRCDDACGACSAMPSQQSHAAPRHQARQYCDAAR